jgi:tryptophanyl-tRNA synthetase
VTDSSTTHQPASASRDGRQRVVSGMRPTGRLHIGHLIGALGNWVPLQSQYDCFYFVADWHALTSDFADTTALTSYAYENVADWIGAGLDPELSTFFVQSLVPEHAELYLLLSMVVPVPWLERVPTYKEQQEDLKEKDLSSIGFLGYPLLQTADVAIYDAQWVPVGGDQVAHLEFAREAVRRFNNFFGEVLVEPKPMLTEFKRLPGLDGDKKMSKSLGNTIDLADTADQVKKKVMRMYTDPKRVRADIPGTVEGNPVFVYHDAFNPNTAEIDDLKDRYRTGRVGDVEVKTKLAAALNAYLDPIRERRAAAIARPDHLKEILVEGSRRARVVAAETMERVRGAMNIVYK